MCLRGVGWQIERCYVRVEAQESIDEIGDEEASEAVAVKSELSQIAAKIVGVCFLLALTPALALTLALSLEYTRLCSLSSSLSRPIFLSLSLLSYKLSRAARNCSKMIGVHRVCCVECLRAWVWSCVCERDVCVPVNCADNILIVNSHHEYQMCCVECLRACVWSCVRERGVVCLSVNLSVCISVCF